MDRVATIDRDCIMEASGVYDAEVTHGIQANWSPYFFPRSVAFKFRSSGEIGIAFSYIDRESRGPREKITSDCTVIFGAVSGRILGLEVHLPARLFDGSHGGREISERIRQKVTPAIVELLKDDSRSKVSAEVVNVVLQVLFSEQHADAFEMGSDEVGVNDIHAD
jgi:hypothetical protein